MHPLRSLPFAFVLTLFCLCAPRKAAAQDHGFGVGLMIGEPTGISLKTWLKSDRALDFGIAWGLDRAHYLHLHGDYLFHKMDLIPVSKGKLPLYFGPGLRIRSWTDGHYWHRGHYVEYDGGSRLDLSVRFPVGLAYLFEGAPLDVFLEVVPNLDLVPDTDVDFDGALGLRYWFK